MFYPSYFENVIPTDPGTITIINLQTEDKSALVSWTMKSQEACNGVVVNYTVFYTTQNGTQLSKSTTDLFEVWNWMKILPLMTFLSSFSSRCYCRWHTPKDLFERSKTKDPIQHLCHGYGSYWNYQKQWVVHHNQKIWWVVFNGFLLLVLPRIRNLTGICRHHNKFAYFGGSCWLPWLQTTDSTSW